MKMINQLVHAIDGVRTTFYNTLYYSFKIGQFLIYGFRLLTDLFLLILKGFHLFLIALSESFALFSEDISYAIQQVAEITSLIINEFQQFTSTLFYLLEIVLNAFVLIHGFFNDAIQTSVNLVTLCAVQVKKLLILFGSGIWFSVTFLPLLIYNLGLILTNFVCTIFEEIGAFIIRTLKNCKLSLNDFYDFVTDVPFESVLGLIVTLSLIYVFTQFYMVIFTCMLQQLQQLSSKIRRLFNRTRQIRILSYNFSNNRTRFPQVRRSLSTQLPQNKVNVNQSNDDLDCVICQERTKCILLLPCRHVCMCSECSDMFQLYDNACPICRNHIEETMRIFV